MLRFRRLDIDLSAVDCCNLHVDDEVLGYSLVLESNESKASGLPGVDVLQDDSAVDFTELRKVLF